MVPRRVLVGRNLKTQLLQTKTQSTKATSHFKDPARCQAGFCHQSEREIEAQASHGRLRVFELSMSTENPPVMPASIGDLYTPRSRSVLPIRLDTLASTAAFFRG